MSAIDEMKAALRDARTEAATLRIEKAQLKEENETLVRVLVLAYGLNVPCDKCGAPALAPCMSDTGRVTVHSTRVTKSVAAIPANDTPASVAGSES